MKRPQQITGDRSPARQIRVFPEMAASDRNGLPDSLKTNIENLSGVSMDDVRVHYDSPRVARLRAQAYTQGADIHVGRGQEKHLAHEAWHVAQQKQGRVKPTMRMAGAQINDDAALEHEAEVMATKAFLKGPDRALTGPAARKQTSEPGEKEGAKGTAESEAAATGAPVEKARLNPISARDQSSPPAPQGSAAGVVQRTVEGNGRVSWYRNDHTANWLMGLSSEHRSKAHQLLDHDNDHSHSELAEHLGISADNIPKLEGAAPAVVAAAPPKAEVRRPTDDMPDALNRATITYTKSSAFKHGHTKEYIANTIRNLGDLNNISGGYASDQRKGSHTYSIRHQAQKIFGHPM